MHTVVTNAAARSMKKALSIEDHRKAGNDSLMPIEPTFSHTQMTTRQQERIQRLAKHLIDGKARSAAIVGPPGTGKTALALGFGDLFRERLPNAAVVHTYAFMAQFASPPDIPQDRPLLLIIDEYENLRKHARTADWWSRALKRKDTRVIFTATSEDRLPEVDFRLATATLIGRRHRHVSRLTRHPAYEGPYQEAQELF
jgi:DNA replication protein DnaC